MNIWRSRGYLPHIEAEHGVQVLSFRLADALPAEAIASWIRRLAADGALSQHARKILLRKKVEEYLDSGHGSCALADAAVARIVEQSLLHFDGERYRLLAWVVMPNHVHVVLKTWPHWRHGRVVHSWKSYSAKRINEHLGLKGRLWQPEYHDRLVLSEKQLQRVLDYVEWNPVKAGLCARPEEWPWGSAACRCR